MKKIFIYIVFVVLVCFLIPILFTKKQFINAGVSLEEENTEQYYDYGQYNRIKL